jgi:hypothetical protein
VFDKVVGSSIVPDHEDTPRFKVEMAVITVTPSQPHLPGIAEGAVVVPLEGEW